LQTGFIQFANWLRDDTWLQFANGNLLKRTLRRNETLSTATMAADQTAEQKRLFTEAMVKKISKQGDERSQFLTEARYDDVCAALDGWTGKDGPAKKETQQNFNQVYAWVRKYDLVNFSGHKLLVFKDKDEADEDEEGEPALDQSKIVSHQGRVFEDLHKIHIAGGHCKAKTFAARIQSAHGKSVPRWVSEVFVMFCPTCVRRVPRKPSSAGHKPILTKGLGSRGQVDLVDFQSCADGSFKFLLNYQDHGAFRRAAVPCPGRPE